MDFRKLYKNGRNSSVYISKKRAEVSQCRQETRQKILDSRRQNLLITHETPAPAGNNTVEAKNKKEGKSRLDLLKEWQEKKKRIKEEEKKKKNKPAFCVGKVHYKPSGSPALENKIPPPKHNNRNPPTRFKEPDEQEKLNKAFCKIVGNKKELVAGHEFRPPARVAAISMRLTIPNSPKITKSARKLENALQENSNMKVTTKRAANTKKTTKKENVKKKIEFPLASCSQSEDTTKETAVVAMEKSPMTAVNRSPDTKINETFLHLEYSPFIKKRRTTSNGSSSASNVKLTLQEKIDKEIMKEDIEKRSNIHCFRLFIQNESERLLKKCEEWKKLRNDDISIPDEVKGDIDVAIGKTQLLTSDKFLQFANLINQCELGDVMVKLDDLKGFRDWVSLEVDDLDRAFFNLEANKQTNWKKSDDKQDSMTLRPAKPKRTNKPVVNKNVPSRIRAHIRALRNKNKGEEVPEVEAEIVKPSPAKELSTPTSLLRSSQKPITVSGLEILSATRNVKLLGTPQTPKSIPASPYVVDLTTPVSILRRRRQRGELLNKSVTFQTHNEVSLENNKENISPQFIRMAKRRSRTKSSENRVTPLRRSARLAAKTPQL